MSDYRSIWEQIDKPKQERKMTEKEQAVNDAICSGAVQAWLCGQDIQWRLKGQIVWKDFDRGGNPDFTALTTEWRASPVKLPVIRWFKLADVEPNDGESCLISDGTSVRLDRWRDGDWKRRSKLHFPQWSPLPLPPGFNK